MDQTPAESPGVPARSGRSPRDMAISMLVLLIPVMLLVGLYRFLGNEEPPILDPAPAYAAARAANAFPVLEPALPPGWQVQSAQYRQEEAGGVLRVGLRAADGGPMQLIESAATAGSLVPIELGGKARELGTVEVNGRSWQRYGEGRQGERALVLAEPTRTVIIYGSAPDETLRSLAEALPQVP